MGYNKDFKGSEDLKLQLVSLVRDERLSITQAANTLDINPRTAQKFFQGSTQWAKEWWQEFNKPVEFLRTSKHTEVKENSQIECLLKNPYEESFLDTVSEENINRLKSESKSKKILVVADTQAKPNVSLDYMKWIGKYIFDKKPDIVVHIGDAYDFESLSSYDKGKKSFEGRRLKADIEAGNESIRLLLNEFQKDGYNPRLVFCMGNHEQRFDRLSENMPELDGFVGSDTLPLAEMGWEVQPFLKPISIEGIFFVHYLANPFTGKPYGGNAMNQLKTVGNSFVVGHKQCLDVAIRPTLDGKHQIGIINGAAYDFHEAYKGETGNNHFRGITMLHEVKDGFGLPMFISLDYLKERYS